MSLSTLSSKSPSPRQCPRRPAGLTTAGRQCAPVHCRVRLIRQVVLLAALHLQVPAQAADLGVAGPTYPITEPHLLRHIDQTLREKQRSGELDRLMAEARQRGLRTVNQPTPVAGLNATTRARTHWMDPSITLDRPISDANGRLLFAAGTRVNPLDVVAMSRSLLFFDGRDERQVRRARQLLDAQPGKLKPVLTGGSYLALMKSWRIPVYFDQQGLLVKRLGIRQVPALVSQQGRQLRIDELALP
jgi:conjugal transfer pilus assembly protein TraW